MSREPLLPKKQGKEAELETIINETLDKLLEIKAIHLDDMATKLAEGKPPKEFMEELYEKSRDCASTFLLIGYQLSTMGHNQTNYIVYDANQVNRLVQQTDPDKIIEKFELLKENANNYFITLSFFLEKDIYNFTFLRCLCSSLGRHSQQFADFLLKYRLPSSDDEKTPV